MSADTRPGLAETLARLPQQCWNCEGSGQFWADGKAHSPSYKGPTMRCSECDGTGKVAPQLPTGLPAALVAVVRAAEEHEHNRLDTPPLCAICAALAELDKLVDIGR